MASPFDRCPWHPKRVPTVHIETHTHNDGDVTVYVVIRCPVCSVRQEYTPTDKEINAYYGRYSHNKKLIKAVMPKLLKKWNWKAKNTL